MKTEKIGNLEKKSVGKVLVKGIIPFVAGFLLGWGMVGEYIPQRFEPEYPKEFHQIFEEYQKNNPGIMIDTPLDFPKVYNGVKYTDTRTA